MKKYSKKLIPMLVALALPISVNAEIIDVTLDATASGNYFFDVIEGSPPNPFFDAPQISEQFGSRSDGSAGAFDSFSDFDGDEILFKNGNSAFGRGGFSESRTVVDIEFKNTSGAALIPTLQSQILPAGMGIYLSDCTAENVRDCEAISDPLVTFDDIGLEAFNGTESFVNTSFDFKVLINGDIANPLFSLSGSLGLQLNSTNDALEVVQELTSASNVLDNFRQTSVVDSLQEISFDWGATDFEVVFPSELLSGQTATLSYIIETSTETNSDCDRNGICPVAYAAFGDPIGRGGSAGTRQVSTRSALASAAFATATNFVMSNDIPINGYEAGLYRMALPTFEDGILTYKANSGPGIAATSVSAPATAALLVMGMIFIGLRRKRFLQ